MVGYWTAGTLRQQGWSSGGSGRAPWIRSLLSDLNCECID